MVLRGKGKDGGGVLEGVGVRAVKNMLEDKVCRGGGIALVISPCVCSVVFAR